MAKAVWHRCCYMEIINMRQILHKRTMRTGGFSMADVLGAVLIIGLALTGLFAANTRATVMLKSSKQAAVASKCLQQRIEQLRAYNWTEVTDAQAIQDLY